MNMTGNAILNPMTCKKNIIKNRFQRLINKYYETN
jgi:hypothetical protein